ncbi:MAG TPA: hypothetical protein DEQ26_00765 [Flavobacteriaceae bacterium]|nr:hypothetical protein [Flavobacteriaceae bacterium]
MKTILKVAFCTFSIFSFFGCQNDDYSKNNTVDKELNGIWNLDKTYGFYPDQAFIQHEKGKVIWEFNTSTKKLNVLNHVDETAGIVTGNYDFYTSKEKLNDKIEYKILYVENKKQGDFYKIAGDSLVINYGSDLDGYIFVFKK